MQTLRVVVAAAVFALQPGAVLGAALYEVTTLAGGSRGSADGVGGAARFYNPAGIAMDAASGVALVVDF